MSDPPAVMPEGLVDFDGVYGALEMFDSTSMPTPLSPQANAVPFASSGHVVGHVMMEDVMPPPSSKKHKRHKAASGHAAGPSLPSDDGRSKKKHKKSNKDKRSDHQVPSSQPQAQSAPDDQQFDPSAPAAAGGFLPSTDTLSEQIDHGDESALLSTKSKKKRKVFDSADGKRRKKRHPHGHDDAQEAGDGEGAGIRDAGADFLRKSNDAGIPSASAVDDNVQGSDPQQSPTVAHLLRRSHSREARSRENSVLPAEAGRVEVDPRAGDVASADATADQGASIDANVEALAREAWNEHRNGQGPIVNTQEPNGTSVDAQTAEPSKRRSTRKKAKPTFFEQPPAEVSNDDANATRDAFGQLPSPMAMTPKPRRTAKAAAKKTAKAKKSRREKPIKDWPPPSRFHGDGAGEGNGENQETGRVRRNRLVGFTRGRFSDDELERIANAIESFRAMNDLTQAEVTQVSARDC